MSDDHPLPPTNFESDIDRLTRWSESLRRSSAATRAEAERHGSDWEFYGLSVDSAQAQGKQAQAMERKLVELLSMRSRPSS